MEEVLGAHNDDQMFARFLAHWPRIMADRITEATTRIGGIRGVEGLILAGSNGTGCPWPLSDIDLIPIYADDKQTSAIAQVEQTRLALLDAWSAKGWRTGVDVGRLRFTVQELETVFAAADPDPLPLLADERWYHSIDKAYGGRALIDSHGYAARLVTWLTTHRFTPSVVTLRLERSLSEACASLELVDNYLSRGDRAGAFAALLKSIAWYQIHLMERWGERDNSLGRFGTRFEWAAHVHGSGPIRDELNALSSLAPERVSVRLGHAPSWVRERRDRSLKARRHIGESVTALQNNRDVLRVSTMYELRKVTAPPYQAWLSIPSESGLQERAQAMCRLLQQSSMD